MEQEKSSKPKLEVQDEPLSLRHRIAPLIILACVVLGAYTIKGNPPLTQAPWEAKAPWEAEDRWEAPSDAEPDHPIKPTVQALLAEFDQSPPIDVFGFDYDDASYIITGSPGVHASLRYVNSAGVMVHIDDIRLPWRIDFRPGPDGPHAITAQNTRNQGTVKCTVIWKYRIISQATSEEAHGIVTC